MNQGTTVTSVTTAPTPTRQAAITGLAIVGFIALVGAGMWLAVYSSRFVPGAVSRIGSAAVSLSSIFNSGGSSSLSVVPGNTSSTTISFGDGATTTTPTPATSGGTSKGTPTPVGTTAGQQTSNTVQISGGSGTAPLSGLPDLAISTAALGYLTTSSTDSFVASTTVPAGMRPAIKFTVRNVGSNTSGSWHFLASIPTQNSYVYQSPAQQSLLPGDSIDYTLGFDQPRAGVQTISVSTYLENGTSDGNSANNSITATTTILGS